jgi:Spy/CpxP family protein refolding chaperone
MKKSLFAKILIGCVALMMVSLAGFAQKSPEQRVEKQVQKLKTELQLSDDQTAKVQATTQKRADQVQTMRNGSKENKRENRAKLKTTMEEYDAEMKAILTPEQYTKFEEIREDKKERMMEKRKNKKGNK